MDRDPDPYRVPVSDPQDARTPYYNLSSTAYCHVPVLDYSPDSVDCSSVERMFDPLGGGPYGVGQLSMGRKTSMGRNAAATEFFRGRHFFRLSSFVLVSDSLSSKKERTVMDTDKRYLVQFAGDERDLRTRSFVLAAHHFQRFNGLLVEVPVNGRKISWLVGLSLVGVLSDVLYGLGNKPLSDRGYVYRLGNGLEVRCLGLPSHDSDFGRQHMVELARTAVGGSFVVTVEYPVTVSYHLDGIVRGDIFHRESVSFD